MKRIKRVLKAIMTRKMFYRLLNVYLYLKCLIKNERYKMAYFHSKRKNTKEKYCIIRFQRPEYALLAAGIQYVFIYEWAISKGFIPVLDLEYEYDYQRYEIGQNN